MESTQIRVQSLSTLGNFYDWFTCFCSAWQAVEACENLVILQLDDKSENVETFGPMEYVLDDEYAAPVKNGCHIRSLPRTLVMLRLTFSVKLDLDVQTSPVCLRVFEGVGTDNYGIDSDKSVSTDHSSHNTCNCCTHLLQEGHLHIN